MNFLLTMSPPYEGQIQVHERDNSRIEIRANEMLLNISVQQVDALIFGLKMIRASQIERGLK